MAGFLVDAKRCKRCGICAKVCPARIIDWQADEKPRMETDREKRCIRCGQCMAFCPAGACTAPGIPAALETLDASLLPSPEAVEELLAYRRSIRNFTKTAVAHDMLVHLADVTRYAPTAQNRQALRWIVAGTRERVTELARLTVEWLESLPDTDPVLAARMQAPGMVSVYRSGYDIIMRGAPHLLIAAGPDEGWAKVDAAIALTYLEIAAVSRGIGACWAGYFTIACGHPAGKAIRGALGLAPGEGMLGAQMLGYPAFRPAAKPWRKPLNITEF